MKHEPGQGDTAMLQTGSVIQLLEDEERMRAKLPIQRQSESDYILNA